MGTAVTRYIIALVSLTIFAGPVLAGALPDDDPMVLQEKQKKKDAEETYKRYKSTLKNTEQGVAPVRSDPWQNMRGADDFKSKR